MRYTLSSQLYKKGEIMKFSDVMAYYDYKMSNIVKAIPVARDTVKKWKRNNKIPFNMQCILEVISDRTLKATKEDKEE
jgi:hypothetical protein